jgi:hypothetical protein
MSRSAVLKRCRRGSLEVVARTRRLRQNGVATGVLVAVPVAFFWILLVFGGADLTWPERAGAGTILTVVYGGMTYLRMTSRWR